MPTADIFFAASLAVKNMLTENFNVPENKIFVFYEFYSPSLNVEPIPSDLSRKINNAKLVVGGVGFVDYRKGFDLFLETVRVISNVNNIKDILFVWLGAFGRGKDKIVKKFIELNQLGDQVYFTGEVKNTEEYYKAFDVLFIPSREDPFPLVMLESAWFGKPIICFNNSGGITEFVDKEVGILIDSLDPGKTAREIIYLANNKDKLLLLGNSAKRKVAGSYTIDIVAPRIHQKIQSLM